MYEKIDMRDGESICSVCEQPIRPNEPMSGGKVVRSFKQRWTFLKYYFETILSVAPSQNLLETLQKALGTSSNQTTRGRKVRRKSKL